MLNRVLRDGLLKRPFLLRKLGKWTRSLKLSHYQVSVIVTDHWNIASSFLLCEPLLGHPERTAVPEGLMFYYRCFLAFRTNGYAYGTVLHLSVVCHLSQRNVLWLNGAS